LKESEDGQLLMTKKLKNFIKNKNVSVLDLHQLHEKLNLSNLQCTLNKITVQNKTQNTIQRYELRNRRDYNNTKTRISDANQKHSKIKTI